jgi:hypothetical protein
MFQDLALQRAGCSGEGRPRTSLKLKLEIPGCAVSCVREDGRDQHECPVVQNMPSALRSRLQFTRER